MNLLFWKRKRFKPFLLENKYKVIPAFHYKGVDYYQFDTAFEIPAGRAMASLTIYEEFNQRCDKGYLQKHCKAMSIAMQGPKIDIGVLATLNNNLRERLEMLQLPEHIYKLASVLFFDKSESPYAYDFDYNRLKISRWKQDPDALDFFLKTPFKDLMPSSQLARQSAGTYFQVAEKVNELHHSDLEEVLSKAQ